MSRTKEQQDAIDKQRQEEFVRYVEKYQSRKPWKALYKDWDSRYVPKWVQKVLRYPSARRLLDDGVETDIVLAVLVGFQVCRYWDSGMEVYDKDRCVLQWPTYSLLSTAGLPVGQTETVFQTVTSVDLAWSQVPRFTQDNDSIYQLLSFTYRPMGDFRIEGWDQRIHSRPENYGVDRLDSAAVRVWFGNVCGEFGGLRDAVVSAYFAWHFARQSGKWLAYPK